jgi:hypothetical protein
MLILISCKSDIKFWHRVSTISDIEVHIAKKPAKEDDSFKTPVKKSKVDKLLPELGLSAKRVRKVSVSFYNPHIIVFIIILFVIILFS